MSRSPSFKEVLDPIEKNLKSWVANNTEWSLDFKSMSNCVLRDILYLLIWEGNSVLWTLLVHNACLYTKRTVVRNTIMMIRDSPGEFLTERLRCLISQSYFCSFCSNLSLACRSEMSARLQWNKWTHHSPVTVSRWYPHTSCFISAEFALVLSVEHVESVHHSKMT